MSERRFASIKQYVEDRPRLKRALMLTFCLGLLMFPGEEVFLWKMVASAQNVFGTIPATRTGFEIDQDLSVGTMRYLHMTGILGHTTATSATGTGTGEQTLGTFNVAANALDIVGRRLHVHASFSAAANGNNKTFKCYFGASVISSGVLTTNAKNGDCDLYVVKTGSNTQIVSGKMIVDTTAITGFVNTTSAEVDTAAIAIKFTATDGSSSAGDIVMNDLFAEYQN